jgi:hypothetical protein
VYLDLKNSSLLRSETYPVKVSMILKGSLPSPCHQLRVAKSITSTNQINLKVYSVYDPTQACITMLQPFSVTISLGTFSSGTYSIYVNGLFFSKFTVSAPVLSN